MAGICMKCGALLPAAGACPRCAIAMPELPEEGLVLEFEDETPAAPKINASAPAKDALVVEFVDDNPPAQPTAVPPVAKVVRALEPQTKIANNHIPPVTPVVSQKVTLNQNGKTPALTIPQVRPTTKSGTKSRTISNRLIMLAILAVILIVSVAGVSIYFGIKYISKPNPNNSPTTAQAQPATMPATAQRPSTAPLDEPLPAVTQQIPPIENQVALEFPGLSIQRRREIPDANGRFCLVVLKVPDGYNLAVYRNYKNDASRWQNAWKSEMIMGNDIGDLHLIQNEAAALVLVTIASGGSLGSSIGTVLLMNNTGTCKAVLTDLEIYGRKPIIADQRTVSYFNLYDNKYHRISLNGSNYSEEVLP